MYIPSLFVYLAVREDTGKVSLSPSRPHLKLQSNLYSHLLIRELTPNVLLSKFRERETFKRGKESGRWRGIERCKESNRDRVQIMRNKVLKGKYLGGTVLSRCQLQKWVHHPLPPSLHIQFIYIKVGIQILIHTYCGVQIPSSWIERIFPQLHPYLVIYSK